MRAGTAHVEEVLSRQGRYRTVRDNLRVKEVRLQAAPDLRWVLCHNPDEAIRAAAQREAALDRIGTELARIKTARSRLAAATPTTAAAIRRRDAELASHSRAECERAAVLAGAAAHRVAERRTGQTWPTLAREMGRLHAVTLTGPTGTVTQTTELTTAQQAIVRACGVTPPPRITALHPA